MSPRTAAAKGASEPKPRTRKQVMLYGIASGGLGEVTRTVPVDEPPPLAENSKLSVIGKPIPRFEGKTPRAR